MLTFIIFLVVTCNENFCYYLLKKRQQWFAASEECRRFHGDLLSIHDASENEWIANTVLSERNIEEVHLGKLNNFEGNILAMLLA